MEDKTPKQKKGVRRAAKAASSPIPFGPTGGAMDDAPSACGHMACTGGKCNVRYVGPVSYMRDHHVIHAARQASHIWSAAIVTGLAIVLTGALGYAAIGAEATNQAPSLYGEFQQINNRLSKIEGMVKTLLDRCESGTCGQAKQQPQQQPTPEQCISACKKEFGDNIEKANACIKDRCEKKTTEQSGQDQTQCKAACEARVATLDYTQEQRDASVKACMESSCPKPPTADACAMQCKDKYRDDPKAVSACLQETCGTAPLSPISNAGNQTATGTAPTGVEQCLKKCYDERVACFKEAGSNYTALRACVTKETSCKSACTKQ